MTQQNEFAIRDDGITSIRDIVMDVVTARIGGAARPYMGAIDVVIERLEARDRAICTFLLDEARDEDLDPRKVQNALIECGLMPAPPTNGEVESDDMPQWARTLMDRMDALERRG